jgi:hypothetical protein
MNWKDSFRAALVTVDPAKLLDLIHGTETAMVHRSESSPTISNEELNAISDATRTLHILKNHALAESRFWPVAIK